MKQALRFFVAAFLIFHISAYGMRLIPIKNENNLPEGRSGQASSFLTKDRKNQFLVIIEQGCKYILCSDTDTYEAMSKWDYEPHQGATADLVMVVPDFVDGHIYTVTPHEDSTLLIITHEEPIPDSTVTPSSVGDSAVRNAFHLAGLYNTPPLYSDFTQGKDASTYIIQSTPCSQGGINDQIETINSNNEEDDHTASPALTPEHTPRSEIVIAIQALYIPPDYVNGIGQELAYCANGLPGELLPEEGIPINAGVLLTGTGERLIRAGYNNDEAREDNDNNDGENLRVRGLHWFEGLIRNIPLPFSFFACLVVSNLIYWNTQGIYQLLYQAKAQIGAIGARFFFDKLDRHNGSTADSEIIE